MDVGAGAEDQAATASVTTDVDSFDSGPGFLYTPVAPEKPHIMHRYYAHERCDPEIVKSFCDFYVHDYDLDVPIWSNKIYKETPLLAEPEKDFDRFRRWYRQRYSNVEAL